MQKSYSYLFSAMFIFIVLLVLQHQLALYFIAFTAPEVAIGPELMKTDHYIRSHTIVVYGGFGLVLLFLSCALDNFLLDTDQRSFHLRQLSRLITFMMRWAMVFIIGDIIFQNWDGSNITIWNYTMRPRTIAALGTLELCTFLTFLSGQKAIPPLRGR
jgi:hypothetical protein